MAVQDMKAVMARIEHPEMVSREAWIAARKDLLDKEKAHMRAGDVLAAQRRALPWVRIDAPYRFEGPNGVKTLPELFGGRSQLIVYHFMFDPAWDEGCPGCSFLADHIDGANQHLAHHDVTLLAVSRAPLAKLQAYRRRMGWRFDWYSSAGSDFNSDFNVSPGAEEIAANRRYYNYEWYDEAGGEWHGLSVFYKGADGIVYHTYSTYARGCDVLIGAHHYLDLTPKGRNEHSTMDWMRRHDQYETVAPKHSCCAAD